MALRHELGLVVRANVGGHPAGLHEADEFVDHVLRGDAPAAQQGGALPGVLIDHREPLQGAAAFVPVEDEVKRPDVVPVLRAVAVAGVLA